MMRLLGQATSQGSGRHVSFGTLILHRFMKKIGGKRGMEKIGGKSGMEKIGGKSGMENIGGKNGVSLPGIQLVDRILQTSTRRGIRHCFNGKSDGDER